MVSSYAINETRRRIFINFIYMTTSVRFCLSYGPIKWDFMAFKTTRKCFADTDIVNNDLQWVQHITVLRSISQKISFLVQNSGVAAYFCQTCWTILQSKNICWLLNFISPSAACGEIMQRFWKIGHNYKSVLKL